MGAVFAMSDVVEMLNLLRIFPPLSSPLTQRLGEVRFLACICLIQMNVTVKTTSGAYQTWAGVVFISQCYSFARFDGHKRSVTCYQKAIFVW